MNEKRLEKVLQALSGKERALVFLREYKDGSNMDPAPVGVAFLSAREHNEYARLIDLIRVCSNELADIMLIVKEQVAQEELRFAVLQQMVTAADDLWQVRRYLRTCAPEKTPERKELERVVRRARRIRLPLDIAGPIGPDTKSPEVAARTIAIITRDRLASYWRQLKAVELVVGEFAEEFDGEDPWKPELRGHHDDALARIVALRDDLVEYIGAWVLPDDPGEPLALTRKLVEQALR